MGVFKKVHSLPEGYVLNPKIFEDYTAVQLPTEYDIFKIKVSDVQTDMGHRKRAAAQAGPLWKPIESRIKFRTAWTCNCPVGMTYNVYSKAADIDAYVTECNDAGFTKDWHADAQKILKRGKTGKMDMYPVSMYHLITAANLDYRKKNKGMDNVYMTLLQPMMSCASGRVSAGMSCMVMVGNLMGMRKGPIDTPVA